MARIRTIKPQFWLDEKLGTISRDARLLYIGLWNLSDDQGVFEWRPSRIKAQLFPYDMDIKSSDLEKWLDLLTTTGDVLKFAKDGQFFGYIPTFKKHQEIKKPSKWIFATPPNSNSTLPVPYQFPTSSPREKEKLEGIGSKESIADDKNNSFISLKEQEAAKWKALNQS